MNDKDNIILFPTNRIKNKETVKHPVDPKEHQKLVEEQTKEFVEGNVDDIAYQLLDKFVNMGIRTNKLTFTADLALVIDAIRGLVYRDFNKLHPAQQLADKMVSLYTKGKSYSWYDFDTNFFGTPAVQLFGHKGTSIALSYPKLPDGYTMKDFVIEVPYRIVQNYGLMEYLGK